MTPQVTRLSSGARSGLLALGAALALAGLVLIVLAVVDFVAAFGGAGMPQRFWMFFLGAPLLFAGIAILKFALLKPLSEIVATETEGAVEVSGGALGRGLRAGGVGAAVPVVRIKCRACGYLESEDATFCSNCAQAM